MSLKSQRHIPNYNIYILYRASDAAHMFVQHARVSF